MSSNFFLFLMGFLIAAAGVGYAMHSIGLASQWIIAAMLIFAGIGIISALSRSKKGDLADAKADKYEQEALR